MNRHISWSSPLSAVVRRPLGSSSVVVRYPSWSSAPSAVVRRHLGSTSFVILVGRLPRPLLSDVILVRRHSSS